jgi:tRNA A37 threonylcarbamoyladenosine synthetase subunit TsaC/SUA5/YrdC
LPNPLTLDEVLVMETDLAIKFNNGKIRKSAPSTIVEADESGVRLVREGAISRAEIKKIVPNLG